MKKFYSFLSFLIMAILCVDSAFCQSGKPLFPQTPGLVSYTHRKSFPKDVAATLDTIKALGITDMEFSNLFGKTPEELPITGRAQY